MEASFASFAKGKAIASRNTNNITTVSICIHLNLSD